MITEKRKQELREVAENRRNHQFMLEGKNFPVILSDMEEIDFFRRYEWTLDNDTHNRIYAAQRAPLRKGGIMAHHAKPMGAIIERVCRRLWTDNQTKRKTPWTPYRMACSLVPAVEKERAKAKPALKKVKRESIIDQIRRHFRDHPETPKT